MSAIPIVQPIVSLRLRTQEHNSSQSTSASDTLIASKDSTTFSATQGLTSPANATANMSTPSSFVSQTSPSLAHATATSDLTLPSASSGMSRIDSSTPTTPALGLLLVGTAGAVLLIPLAILFYSHAGKQTRLFSLLSLFVIALGLVEGAADIYVQVQAIQGEKVNSSLSRTLVSLAFIIPVIVQVALVPSLVALYPWHTLSPLRRVAVYGATLTLIVTRVFFVTLCIHGIVTQIPDSDLAAASWQGVWITTYSKIAWSVQLANDLYASWLLLLRVRQEPMPDEHLTGRQLRHDTQHNATTGRCAPALMAVASSFVVPVAFSLAQLVLGILDDPRQERFSALYLILANVYVQIISLLFVGVWYPGIAATALYPETSITRSEHASPRDAMRFLSPLPEHPRIQLYESSYGSAEGSMRDSATIRVDRESTLDLSAEKLKIMEVMPGYQAHGRNNGALEPSVISFSGSVQTDGHGEPVFYAV
ncbi:hypothetical protein BV20DRAFT_709389 [Pilatotrama ljubarskyi]|nr:hypothetical protein BV20DRAFT_709389 [Pilatotrama ljubarskyi]